ncbi:MAG: cytochrome c biogenesis protein CcsA [candidate division WOR-3 bacterium]
MTLSPLVELRLLNATALGLALAGLCYLLGLFLRTRGVRIAATAILFMSWIVCSLSLAARIARQGGLPFQSKYDVLLWFIWWLLLVYLVAEDRTRVTLPGLLVAGTCYGLTHGCLLRMDSSLLPLLPLQTTWLFPAHALTLYAAYGLLATAAAIELSSPLYGRLTRPAQPELVEHEEQYLEFRSYAYRLVLFAFPILSFALLSNALWRSGIRGHYWAWGREETWTLVAWLLYACYLHLRTQLRTSRTAAAVFNILGAGAITLTFTGLDWLVRLFRLKVH